MADNYLEKRMEDLKAGRLRPIVQSKTTGLRKGYLEFPFPSRRVLIVGGTQGLPLDIVRMFLKAGSKVAVIDTDKTHGDILAYREGIRYYNLESPTPDTITYAFSNLLQAWRDVDIMIITRFHHLVPDLACTWTAHRDCFPVPFGYAGRVILLYPESTWPDSEEFSEYIAEFQQDLTNSLQELSTMLKPYRITANAVLGSTKTVDELRDPIRLIQTIVLPGNNFLTSMIIPFQK